MYIVSHRAAYIPEGNEGTPLHAEINSTASTTPGSIMLTQLTLLPTISAAGRK